MRARSTILLALTLLTTAPALAQEAEDGVVAPPEPPEEYQALVQQALAESAEGHWAEARALFTHAYDIFPNARADRGLGMVSFELRDYAEAVRHLRRALVDERRALDETQRAEAESLLERSLAFVGIYTPITLPVDGQLFVDGHDAVVEPDGTILLAVGDHEARVTTPTREWNSRFTVRGGEREVLPLSLEEPTESPPPPPRDVAVAATDDAPPLQMPPAPTGAVVMAISGAVVLVAGVSFLVGGVAASARVEKAEVGTEWSDLTDDYDQAVIFSGLGIAMMAAGGAALGAGLFWITLPRTLTGDVTGVTVGARGTF